MQSGPEPPKAYQLFVERYPKLGHAWGLVAEEGQIGPMDPRTTRLNKLAISIGALREGAVHANVRKALAAGISEDEVVQVVALAAGTLGFPATVAAFVWTHDVMDKK